MFWSLLSNSSSLCVPQLFPPHLCASHDSQFRRSRLENWWARKRRGQAGTGKERKDSPVCLSTLFHFFGLSFQENPCPRTDTETQLHKLHRVAMRLRWSYTSQCCHSAMLNSLNVHGIHNYRLWLLQWALGTSGHPTYYSGLKSFGPCSWELEPVGWMSRHYSNGHEPQKMKELKS